jgi:hypothetical protein
MRVHSKRIYALVYLRRFEPFKFAHLASHRYTYFRFFWHSARAELAGQSQTFFAWFHTVPDWHENWIALPNAH